jgi:hypothetical protein
MRPLASTVLLFPIRVPSTSKKKKKKKKCNVSASGFFSTNAIPYSNQLQTRYYHQ